MLSGVEAPGGGHFGNSRRTELDPISLNGSDMPMSCFRCLRYHRNRRNPAIKRTEAPDAIPPIIAVVWVLGVSTRETVDVASGFVMELPNDVDGVSVLEVEIALAMSEVVGLKVLVEAAAELVVVDDMLEKNVTMMTSVVDWCIVRLRIEVDVMLCRGGVMVDIVCGVNDVVSVIVGGPKLPVDVVV